MNSKSLDERRKISSELSLGLSGQPIYETALNLLAKLPQESKILDFGAGQGAFTSALYKRGFRNLTSADLMPKPESLPTHVNWIQSDLNQDLPDSVGQFEAIIALEVIEHLENPRAVVRAWSKRLKPGGTLVFSTPNNESLRSLISLVARGHYVDFTDASYPAHITALLRKDIDRILSEEGFTSVEYFYTQHGLVPRLTRWSWQQISFGRFRGRFFSDNVVVRAQRAP